MNTEVQAKLSKLKLDQVKGMAVTLFTDYREGADDAFNWVLEYLHQEMVAKEFIAFCEFFDAPGLDNIEK